MKEPLLYRVVRPIITGLVKVVFRPKIIDKHNIPESGKVILLGNHTNNLDCLLLMASTKRCIHFLAKDSLYKGIKKPIFKNMGIIPVNRKVHDKNVLINAENLLNKGGLVGIFPEGTINRTKEVIMPFKIGAVKMGSDTGAEIVPFTITGKYRLFNNDLTIKFEKSYKICNNNLDDENKVIMDVIKNELQRRRNGSNK